jgi:hypothetical protein
MGSGPVPELEPVTAQIDPPVVVAPGRPLVTQITIGGLALQRNEPNDTGHAEDVANWVKPVVRWITLIQPEMGGLDRLA